MKKMNSLFLTALVSLTAVLSAEEKAAEKAPAAQTQEAGKNFLSNGSFTELNDKGMPKWWTLKKGEVVKTAAGNAVRINGRVYQFLIDRELWQKPFERKVAYSFTASGKGKLTVNFYRYTDTPDPREKRGYQRKQLSPAGNGGTYDLTEKLQQFSGEYTINANEWVAFALHASDAIVGDISLRLVK